MGNTEDKYIIMIYDDSTDTTKLIFIFIRNTKLCE